MRAANSGVTGADFFRFILSAFKKRRQRVDNHRRAGIPARLANTNHVTSVVKIQIYFYFQLAWGALTLRAFCCLHESDLDASRESAYSPAERLFLVNHRKPPFYP